LVWRVFRRSRTPHAHLQRYRGRSISIVADRVVPRQMDGEVIDEGDRLNAQIDPGALVIRVPLQAAAAA